VGLHPIAIPHQLPCEQRSEENDQSGGHECGKFENEHIDELNDEEKTRKHFHGLYCLSKDFLVGLPPTPLEKWQQDKDHQSIERGTTDSKQGGSRIRWVVNSKVDKFSDKKGQSFVLQNPIQHAVLIYESPDDRNLVDFEECQPPNKP